MSFSKIVLALLVVMVAIASAAPRYFILDDGEVEGEFKN